MVPVFGTSFMVNDPLVLTVAVEKTGTTRPSGLVNVEVGVTVILSWTGAPSGPTNVSLTVVVA